MSDKPLKPYRSQAEKIAVRQRYIQICVSCVSLLITALTCLKVFDIL